ncbi:AraC family transcriptional regulator [Sphingobacterium humi]|uniref:Helix-turn-helix domain-containing protein n=1 Tax=Sphingobacterium humi TaxID=1796905 RepID=A0A6N8L333_9SPHI|nr:AraC family transcriptional regulator [Sphingobacterium humi]MVZ62911.1 helix-turn-helix domain-containing protein [Sphingobacterium humi]
MKAIEYRLPKEFDKSFIVFNEKGTHFPCPWHYHPEFEFVLVNRSTGKRMVGDHIGYFGEGDLVLMGPELPHVWVNDNSYLEKKRMEAADATVIHFSPDFIGQDIFNIPEFSSLIEILTLSSRGIHIKGKESTTIADIMNNMLFESGLKRLASIFEIFDIICSMKDYDLLASPNFNSNKNSITSRHSKINDFILRNYHKPITLKEVADEANMATTTFCNFFKEQYRMTFVEYVTQIRIGHFCKLISEDDKSILEAAYTCGFNSIANFNRQFKKIKGMSPSEFKRTVDIN